MIMVPQQGSERLLLPQDGSLEQQKTDCDQFTVNVLFSCVVQLFHVLTTPFEMLCTKTADESSKQLLSFTVPLFIFLSACNVLFPGGLPIFNSRLIH
jgi:hypothetical protein